MKKIRYVFGAILGMLGIVLMDMYFGDRHVRKC